MNNRLHNCTNPYQGPSKRVLCVCSAGLLRSPTVANVLHTVYKHNTRACGADVSHALIPLDDVLCTWADQIVIVDKDLQKHIDSKFHNKLVVLNVPDSYNYMDETLQQLIINQYEDATS